MSAKASKNIDSFPTTSSTKTLKKAQFKLLFYTTVSNNIKQQSRWKYQH